MMSIRKMISLKLPPVVLESMDRFCLENQLTRTHYIEDLIRADQKRRGNIITTKKVIRDWDDVDDMPAEPRMIIREKVA